MPSTGAIGDATPIDPNAQWSSLHPVNLCRTR
jgi:hypothetical protein